MKTKQILSNESLPEDNTANQPAFRCILVVLVVLFAAFSSTSYAQQGFTITGQVTNQPHALHPATTITAKNPDTGEVMATSQTSDDGSYSLFINTTAVNDPEQAFENAILVPNPFYGNTRLQTTIINPGEYNLSVYNSLGMLLYNRQMNLPAGRIAIPLRIQPHHGAFVIVSLHNHLQQTTLKGIQNTKHAHGENNPSGNIHASESSEDINRIQAGGYILIGHDRLKNNHNNDITLTFESDGHYKKDTTITRDNHTNINISLDVIPEEILASYSLSATNNPMNTEVSNGSIAVSNEHNTPLLNLELLNGTANGSFEQTEWIYEGDTIRQTNQLTTNITAPNHQPQQIQTPYQKNTNIETTLEQIKQTQTNNVNVQATNNPMNAEVQGLTVEAYKDNNDLIGIFTENNFEIPREYYTNGTDTLPDFETVKFVLKAPHHHDSDTINKQYQDNINLDVELAQIPHPKTAELNMNFTSEPLQYGPNLNITIKNNEDTIQTTTTTNGETTTTIPYTEYKNGEDTLKHINNEPVSNITILASNDKHIEQTYNTPFTNEMNLQTQIEQTPEHGETTITTNLTGNVFGEAPNGVNLTYRNDETNEILTQGESANGTHTAEINYLFWEHEDLYESTLNQIKQEITKPGIYEALEEILQNNDQTTNYTLVQIPQQKTAQIIGTVKNTTQQPIQNADVEILNQETTYANTTTLESGEFQTTMQYQKYTNPENQQEQITNPENIHAKIVPA